MADTYTPCGRGVCAAEDGHDYPCAIASGWATTGEIVAYAEGQVSRALRRAARELETQKALYSTLDAAWWVERRLHIGKAHQVRRAEALAAKWESEGDWEVADELRDALAGEQPAGHTDQQPETD